MPTIGREELDAFLVGRTSDVRVTHLENQGRGQTRVGQLRRRLTAETVELIKTFLSEKKEWVTMLDICEYLDRRPSPQIRQMLIDLVTQEYAEMTQDYGAGPSIPRFWYRAKNKK